jgi:23S rRNA (cytidine1920-2'-O)/16S rRNA (cytidine1409-2'-O)-methyltransferase
LRIDVALVELGLARSRNHASTLIDADRVLINGRAARKASQPVVDGAEIVVLEAVDYVSRAGHKLAKALDVFAEIDPVNKTALDVGASTGGFTDVLLRRGIGRVFAIDVGHDQMALELLDNPKVISMEGFNARDLSLETLAEASGVSSNKIEINLVVGDLSFISLTLVLEQILSVAPKADYVLLIKPQFEVGKQSLHASGIVTDHRLRAGAIKQVVDCAHDLGIGVRGLTRSELPGTHGNIEYVVWISPLEPVNRSKWTDRIEALAKEGK